MSSFPSIRIEGGLLGPELLDQVIAADVPGQKPADFGLEPKRNLTDEIAAAFADSRALWGVFQNRLSHLSEADLATSMTRDSWVIPFPLPRDFSPPTASPRPALCIAKSNQSRECHVPILAGEPDLTFASISNCNCSKGVNAYQS